MEQSPDDRWRQRLQNFEKALGWLEMALAIPRPDVVQRAGMVQFFEVGLIADGRGWLKGLEDRNLTSYTYDEATALQVEQLVRTQYLPLFQALKAKLESL
jgi:Nucleotidyltransferase substrate binding protein like